MERMLRGEVDGWVPYRGPDVHDLIVRAQRRAWRAPVALASAIGAASLAVLLALSLATVLLGPTLPGGDVVKAHLMQAP
jgi:hypothetical protein